MARDAEDLAEVRALLQAAIRALEAISSRPQDSARQPRPSTGHEQLRGWIWEVLADADEPLQRRPILNRLKSRFGYAGKWSTVGKELAAMVKEEEIVSVENEGYTLS